jgi:hypothetical protein
VHGCDTSTWEAETEGSQLPGQPGLHSETLSQKKKKKKPRHTSNIYSFFLEIYTHVYIYYSVIET